MRKELGDDAENQQSRQSRDQIHSGSLKIKQSANVALPLKDHTEYHLAVQIVREREQKQRIAGFLTPNRKRSNKHSHLLRRGLNWMAGGRIRGEMNRVNELKDCHHDG